MEATKQSSTVLADQTIAGVVAQDAEQRATQLLEDITHIQATEVAETQEAYTALHEAVKQVEKVQDFVAPGNQDHILGSSLTKHGEIAEQVEVSIRNARKILDNLKPDADIASVGRTAPEDYLISGAPVQSKFISNEAQSLEHVLKHMDKYPDFTRDAGAYGYPNQAGYYHIPKDQYSNIEKVLHGDATDLSARLQKKCLDFVHEIEARTGKSFDQVVRPSLSNYRDVQLGTIDKTLEGYRKECIDTTKTKVDDIHRKSEDALEEAKQNAGPSWQGAAQAAGAGMLTGGVFGGLFSLYKKLHDKEHPKKFSELTLEDWKSVGIDFGKGAVRGGVTGVSIYALTNVAHMSAPFAGAVVGSVCGIASLYKRYKNGQITKRQFTDAALALGLESGISAVGAGLGQALIPIPVIGAVIGTVVAKAVITITKFICGNREKTLIEELNRKYEAEKQMVNAEAQRLIAIVDAELAKFSSLIDAACDPDLNMRLAGSIALARECKVAEEEIIHSTDELDDFMLN